MPGEIIVVSRNFCGRRNLENISFYISKTENTRDFRMEIPHRTRKNWWQICFGQVTWLVVPVSIYVNFFTRKYLDFYIR